MNLRTILISLCALTAASCLSQNPPANVRWFVSAEIPFPPVSESGAQPLYLKQVTSRAHLNEPMVWRLSPVELFFDEQERWSVPPAGLVEGVLFDALFTTGPFVESDARGAHELRVNVNLFEGVYGQEDLAVCEIGVVHNDGKLIRQRTFRSTQKLDSREPDELARRLGRALYLVALEVREWTATSG